MAETGARLPLVMITGASSGIGKAVAMAFAREGHPLLLISRHIEPIAELPDNTVYRQADVADYGAIEAAIAAAVAVHGPVGCLVNNAGMADARAFDEVDPASYARELDTNLKGVFDCTKAVLAGMRSRQSGTIINISSVSDRKTAPVALAYTASKYAVVGISEGLRAELQPHGIGVSVLCPGFVDTPLLDRINPDLPQTEAGRNARASATRIQRRLYPPADLARDVLHGLDRNTAVIVSPATARIVWYAKRYVPGTVRWLITAAGARQARRMGY